MSDRWEHHLFILWYIFNLFHGAGFWGPNFWKYVIFPPSLYRLQEPRVLKDCCLGISGGCQKNENFHNHDINLFSVGFLIKFFFKPKLFIEIRRLRRKTMILGAPQTSIHSVLEDVLDNKIEIYENTTF